MIEKLLNVEEVTYTSTLEKEKLIKEVENLFQHTTLRLAGQLTNENEFTAYDTLVIMGWNNPNIKRKAAYLTGEVSNSETGSLINLKISPNSFLPTFAIMAAVAGVIITAITLSNDAADKPFLILGLVLLTLGIIYYPLSSFLRIRLRNKVVKYLDLNRV